MVVGKSWRTKNNQVRKFTIKYRWHPQCWVQDGLDYLERNPYTGLGKGKPSLNLDNESKIARRKILVRRAGLIRKMREATDVGNIDQVLSLFHKVDALKEEIKPYGGVPKSWETSLTNN